MRVPLDTQNGKRAQKLFKSQRRHFSHIYFSLFRQLSLKKSILVVWKILTMFVNTFTAYDKYSVLNREYLAHPIHLILSQKQKSFSEFFSPFLKSRLNFEHIKKKRWQSSLMYFLNYGLPETWQEKCKKSTASECSWTRKMVNGPKNCRNLNGGTLIIFIDIFEGNWVSKSQS